MEFSVVMPCLNEAATLRSCIQKARECFTRLGLNAEVVVADNGSTDSSKQIALDMGARVIDVPERGYGAALRAGIAAAQGKYVIIGDADDSYDFSRLDLFVEKLRDGSQLVMGNRFLGGIRRGAMPFLHQYLGNPVLSFIGQLFFRSRVRDFHCGLRGFEREAIERLRLQSTGMEFASEMVVKASLGGLSITEVPTTLSPDGRGRRSHLRTWRDGWRHLRFLLTFSPRWLFLYPGLALFFGGALLQAVLWHGSVKVGPFGLGIHSMLYSAAMSILGAQMVWFALLAKVYGVQVGMLPKDDRLERALSALTLERGIAIGSALLLGGVAMSLLAVGRWAKVEYGPLDPVEVMKIAIPSVSMMLIGMEFIVASFFLGMLRIERPHATAERGAASEGTPRTALRLPYSGQ